MAKKTVYTKITPLPSQIPRQLALDMLHSHGEIIELNPLVTGYTPVKAPKDASADEFFAQWYEISEKINFGFGMNKKINFKGVFHDMPWGLQTHTYIPLGIDLRNKWQVRGTQPGEAPEPRELGIDTPNTGLYLREDVEIVANVALTSFVKKEMKAAALAMVERLVRKAELLDEGRLQALFDQGRLKTTNPNVRVDNRQSMLSPSVGTVNSIPGRSSTGMPSPGLAPQGSPPESPSPQHGSFSQPPPQQQETGRQQYGNYYQVALDRRQSQQQQPYTPSYQQENYSGPSSHQQPHQFRHSQDREQRKSYEPQLQSIGAVEMEGSLYHNTQQQSHLYAPDSKPYAQPPNQAGTSFRSELPGDLAMEPRPQPQQQQPEHSQLHSQAPHRYSQQAHPGAAPGASTSFSSQASSSSAYPSPNPNTHRTSSGGSSRYTPSTEYSPQHAPGDRSLVPDPLKFSSSTAKCPVCGVFEGDERAVEYHVSTHFQQ